jgi:hypothetical protein
MRRHHPRDCGVAALQRGIRPLLIHFSLELSWEIAAGP